MPRLGGRRPEAQAAGLQPGCGRPAGQLPQGLQGGWGGRRAGSGGGGGGRGGCALQAGRRGAAGMRRSMQAAAEPSRSGPAAVIRLGRCAPPSRVSLSCMLYRQDILVQRGQGVVHHQRAAWAWCQRQPPREQSWGCLLLGSWMQSCQQEPVVQQPLQSDNLRCSLAIGQLFKADHIL